MTHQTIDFDDHEVYIGNRPRTAVTLHGPGGWYGTTWQAAALVDMAPTTCCCPSRRRKA